MQACNDEKGLGTPVIGVAGAAPSLAVTARS